MFFWDISELERTVADEQKDEGFILYQVEDGLLVGVILRRAVL